MYLAWQICLNPHLVWRPHISGVEREICGGRLLRERFLLWPFSPPTLSHCIASFSFRISAPPFGKNLRSPHRAKNPNSQPTIYFSSNKMCVLKKYFYPFKTLPYALLLKRTGKCVNSLHLATPHPPFWNFGLILSTFFWPL